MRWLALALLAAACKPAAHPTAERGWQKLPNAPSIAGKQDDLFFVDEQQGWSVDGKDGRVFHTTDGGATWDKQIDRPGTYFRAVLFLDAQHGFVGNIGTDMYPGVTDPHPLYRTDDGGKTLVEVTAIDGPTAKGICNLTRVDDTHLVATGRVGGPSFFLTSDDRGATWHSHDLTSQLAMLIDAHFATPLDGYLVGGSSQAEDSHTVVLHTTDGGQRFTEVYRSQKAGEMGWKFSFPSRHVGYVAVLAFAGGPGAVVKTDDGGATWRELQVTPLPFEAKGVGFVDDKRGGVAGGKADSEVGPGFRTIDGGLTWTPDPSLGNYVNRFRFVGHVGYAIGATVQKIAL